MVLYFYLQKSLPLLRQALFTKELVIEGIKPPPQHVGGGITIQQQLPVSGYSICGRPPMPPHILKLIIFNLSVV